MTHPAFIIKRSTDNQFFFNLTAENGQVILTSEMYTTKAACQNGIESVRRNAAEDHHFERKTSTNEKPYFVLKARNGEIIGNSEMYESAASRDNGIRSVMENAPQAKVHDLTINS